MKSLLLTGGSGLLALNWARTMAAGWTAHLTMHSRQVVLPGAQTHTVDLSSPDDMTRLLDRLRPDLVVNTAGFTSVEGCETLHDAAQQANATVPANVAACCADRNIRLVHISTDHLFDGTVPMAAEDVLVKPLNAYARTKALGEAAVLAVAPDALVIRTNFYGWGPGYRRSFSDRIIDALRRGEETLLFEDVHFTPILADILAETVHELFDHGAQGVYNVVGDERLSKHDFGERIAAVFGLDRGLIRRGRIADVVDLTIRPMEISLSNQRARTLLGRDIGGVDSQLRRLAAIEADARVKEIQAL